MVTGQTIKTNQIFEFPTGLILTPRNPPSPQHQNQNSSTQVSQDNNLAGAEQTPRNQNSDANNINSINRLVDARAGIATQQQPQTATILIPVSTNILIFGENNEKFALFDDLFHKMFKTQREMTESMKINIFQYHSQKKHFKHLEI